MEKEKEKEKENTLSFEQAAVRLDEIVRLLEKGDAPLEKSLTLFEEGATLIKICGKMLDEAEQVVTQLKIGDDGLSEEISFNEK